MANLMNVLLSLLQHLLEYVQKLVTEHSKKIYNIYACLLRERFIINVGWQGHNQFLDLIAGGFNN